MNTNSNTRSMFGLNDINANNITTENLECDYITADIASYAPTVTPSTTSDNRVATTAFVQNAIGSSGFAKLTLDNTFTGYNTFAGGVEIQNNELYINPNTQINLGGNLSVDVGLSTYTITPTELSYLDNTTSNIQTQLNGKATLSAVNTFTNTNNFNQAKGQTANAIVSVKDTTGNKTVSINPNSTNANLNPLVSAGELVVAGVGSAIDTATLTLTTWATANMGLKITPTLCRLRAGTNWFLADSTAGLSCTGALTCSSTINSGSITSTGNIVSNGYINYQSGSKNIYLGTAMGASQYGMYMNYSGTGISTDYGLIQVEHQGTSYRPLVLQPFGSTVGVGINAPTATLDVNGTGLFRQNVSCSVAPTTANHLTTKSYVDSAVSGSSILASNNTFTGTNTFNNSVLVKNTAGTAEYFEVKQATGSVAPNPTLSRVSSSGGAYNTVVSFTNTSGYIGRCILTCPVAIYNAGTGSGGSGTTFNVTLSSVSYQILKNGSAYVAPAYPFVVGGAIPDTKVLQLTGTGSYACEVYIAEVSLSFDITASTTDTYAIQFNYTGSTSLPSSTNTYISCGSVSTFQAVSGTIAMTSSPNTGYQTANYYSSPLYNPTTTMGNDGFCALPRVVNICPCGTIIQSLAKTAPYGFLLADGSTVNIADYPDLFGLIQYDYGYGVYGVSFKLPNLNGTFLRGQGTQTYSGVSYAGPNAGSFQQDQTLTPKQQGFYNLASGSARQCPARFNIGTDPIDTGISTTADRVGSEVRPFNFGVYMYIKY